MGRLLAVVAGQNEAGFLPEPEEMAVRLVYVIPGSGSDAIGRLHIDVHPAFRTRDDVPMCVMTLTARGEAQGQGMAGVMAFLDIGREWVVRAFAEITSLGMHSLWRRDDGG